MSTSVNKVILVGRLGKDPEIRYTSGGTGVANFSLATEESWKDKTSGEKMSHTEWHRLVSWKSVEFIEKYLHKGDMIYVEGKLQTREWTGTDEVKHSTVEINVLDIKPLITARVDEQQKPQTRTTNKPQTRQATPVDISEDIPF